MDIKGDTGGNWRRDKYIDYFHEFPGLETSTVALYSSFFKVSNDYAIILAFFNSVFYCSVTSIILNNKININNISEEEISDYLKEEKENLIVGSAKKHIKLQNHFIELICIFKNKTNNKPYNWLKNSCGNNIKKSYEKLSNELYSFKHMGRFSSDIFIATILKMKHYGMFEDIPLESNELNYKQGSNLTSALLNILYKDNEANEYDKKGFISEENLKLINEKMGEIQSLIKEKYPNEDTNFQTISTKLCSFRNFFKKRRYPGFHQDRQQLQLEEYRKVFPDSSEILDKIYLIRSKLYGKDILGEYNNRIGMRNHLKSYFINTGNIIYKEHKQLNLADF